MQIGANRRQSVDSSAFISVLHSPCALCPNRPSNQVTRQPGNQVTTPKRSAHCPAPNTQYPIPSTQSPLSLYLRPSPLICVHLRSPRGRRGSTPLPLRKNRRKSVQIGGSICVHPFSSASSAFFSPQPQNHPRPHPQFLIRNLLPAPALTPSPPLPKGEGVALIPLYPPSPRGRRGSANRCKSV